MLPLGEPFEWLAFAASLKYCIGNPMFHWTHLELRRVFGIEEILSEKTAELDETLRHFGI